MFFQSVSSLLLKPPANFVFCTKPLLTSSGVPRVIQMMKLHNLILYVVSLCVLSSTFGIPIWAPWGITFSTIKGRGKLQALFSKSEDKRLMAENLNNFPGELEELVLLATLKLEPKAYGVAIQELIEEATQNKVNVRGLYTTLKRLREKQWIRDKPTNDDSEDTSRGLARRYYEVSNAGRLALKQAARVRAEQELYREFISNVPSYENLTGKEVIHA